MHASQCIEHLVESRHALRNWIRSPGEHITTTSRKHANMLLFNMSVVQRLVARGGDTNLHTAIAVLLSHMKQVHEECQRATLALNARVLMDSIHAKAESPLLPTLSPRGAVYAAAPPSPGPTGWLWGGHDPSLEALAKALPMEPTAAPEECSSSNTTAAPPCRHPQDTMTTTVQPNFYQDVDVWSGAPAASPPSTRVSVLRKKRTRPRKRRRMMSRS